MASITELKQKRKSLWEAQNALLDKAPNGMMSADDDTKYQSIQTEFDGLSKTIERMENLTAAQSAAKAATDGEYRPETEADAKAENVTKSKFAKFENEEYRNALFGEGGGLRTQLRAQNLKIQNALSSGVDTEGGYILPPSVQMGIMKLLRASDPLRGVATVITSARDVGIPIQTGRPSFSWLGEGGTYGQTQPAHGKVLFSAFKLGGIITVSDELLQDADFDLVGYLTQTSADGILDSTEAANMTGDGSGKPLGLFATTEVAGVTVGGYTGASTTTVTIDELIETQHSLGRVYRPRAAWFAKDAIFKVIRKLKNSVNGDYLLQPSITEGAPDRLLGNPFYVTDFGNSAATGVKTLMFGDPKAYTIVDRLGLSVKRLDELYAATGQVGFRVAIRTDARLTDGNAFVYFKQA